MFKLFRKLSAVEWLMVVAIIGLTVLQVYCMMTVTDFIQSLIKAITNVYLKNNIDPAILPTLYPEAVDASDKEIWMNALWMLLMSLAYVATQASVGFLAAVVTARWSGRIRKELNEKISSFSQAEIKKFSAASLVTRVTNDCQQIDFTCLLMMRMVFAAPITAIWAIVKIGFVSGSLTWIVAGGLIFMILFLIFAMILMMPKFRIVQKQIDRVNAVTRENLSGIRVIRAYNAEEYQEGKFAEANDALTKTLLFTGRLGALFNPVMIIILDGVSLGIYWLGAYLTKTDASIDYATITKFVMLATQIIMAFLMLLMMFLMWPRAAVCAKRINEVLETETSIKEPENPKPALEKGTVRFEHVSFTYPDGAGNAIEDISFEAKEGERVAFIGSTGCGKSTLINLVPRLYDATGGTVYVDGVDVKELSLQELRDKVAVVPQKGILFKGTVMDNLALGYPELTEEEAEASLKVACADFVHDMQGGLEAEISQGGKNVSGGQKQRLCIARAVAAKPEILIFDDSFSALDYQTDKKVRENLRTDCKGITSLVVAQRIGTIMDADLIIVLENGKAVGQGKHADLLKDCPVYREIALSQLTEEELGL